MLQEELYQIAKQTGCTDTERCREVLERASENQHSSIVTLIESQLVEESAFLQELSKRLGLPWVEDPPHEVDSTLKEFFPVQLAVQHGIFPVSSLDGTILILTADPFDLLARQAVAHSVAQDVVWGMSTRSRLLEALQASYGVGANTFAQLLAESQGNLDEELRQETTNLDEDDSEASIARFVNQIIREALIQRATDIHIEPLDDDLRIRYRVDGVLQEVPIPEQIRLLKATLLSRLKIMANLDIAERRLPQDGRINLELEGQPIDVRVATIPSVEGESISLRLLRQERFDFAGLGLDSDDEAQIRELINLPNGIILITGATGSGKSTSLYTFLSELNTRERRIVTIEDPVEYKLPGVVQIAVKPDIGLTFASGLRSILRGDPNVIMVGEMRDFETAETAIRSALTGHLVFSTLHTNDAVGGITRLIDMGVEPYLVATAVRAFIAQRLLRVLCPECKKPVHLPEEYLQKVGYPLEYGTQVYQATGCKHCRQTGYAGRTAIYEICEISEELTELIAANKPASVIRPFALQEGMEPLRNAGFRKVAQGLTTIDEVLRVTMVDSDSPEQIPQL